MNKEVLVVSGVGGMGQAIARRQGAGKAVLLADFNKDTLAAAADAMLGDGYDVTTHPVDVSSPGSVLGLAEAARALGNVTQVVHTAGLSPAQAPAEMILRVDLLGVALVLAEFGRVIAPGGAGVVIASMAGHMAAPLDPEQQQALAQAPAEELLHLPCTTADPVTTNPSAAYSIAKRANQLRVQAAGPAWGKRGARVNSISPGIIATPMGQQEMAAVGQQMRDRIDTSPARRVGTPNDIADATAFLLGPTSTFITGTDLLVDGGFIAALHPGQLNSLF